MYPGFNAWSFLLLFLFVARGMCIAEDIADLNRVEAVPSIISGASVRITDGDLDVVPPPSFSVVPSRGDSASFCFETCFDYADSSHKRNLLGRMEVSLYVEDGPYGCGRWKLSWSSAGEHGDVFRNPRLRKQVSGRLCSGLIEQVRPLARYRLDIKASSHGTRSRHRRISAVTSVVRLPRLGGAELACTLLLSAESLVILKRFKAFFEELGRRHPGHRRLWRSMAALGQSLLRLESLGSFLPGNGCMKHRLAWGDSVERAFRSLRTGTGMSVFLAAPGFRPVLETVVLEALGEAGHDIAHGTGIQVCKDLLGSIEAFGYDCKISRSEFAKALHDAQRCLAEGKSSYTSSIKRASERYRKTAGLGAWSPAPCEPRERYLGRAIAAGAGFLDVPRQAVGVQVAAIRALTGLLELRMDR